MVTDEILQWADEDINARRQQTEIGVKRMKSDGWKLLDQTVGKSQPSDLRNFRMAARVWRP